MYKRIKYVHNGFSLSAESIANVNDLFKPNDKEDTIDLKISDGKNDVSASLQVAIVNQDSHLPVLKSNTAFSMKLRELTRQSITANELHVQDLDSKSNELKIIVTQSPQFGTLELLTNASYASISEFTVRELEEGRVFYAHQARGRAADRFGFVVYDGSNKFFRVGDAEAEQTAAAQYFHIGVEAARNAAPRLDKNLGLDYLYQIEGLPGRLIMRNELQARDADEPDAALQFKITQQPQFGVLENKEHLGVRLAQFSQAQINENKIFYVLNRKLSDDTITSDYFMFDVVDSHGNELKQNRFDISWSILSFEIEELSVMESEGKVRVHVTKTGNLKQFSMVTCKTYSDTAKSNREGKQFDYVQTLVRLEFNEDESYKACDVMIQRDMEIEPIESFYVVLEDAKYSMIGTRHKVKVNILDKIKGKT